MKPSAFPAERGLPRALPHDVRDESSPAGQPLRQGSGAAPSARIDGAEPAAGPGAAALARLDAGGGAEALQQLGETRLAAGLPDEALVLLRAAALIKPALPGLDAGLALALSGMGQHEAALGHYDGALGEPPTTGSAAVELTTRLLLGQGRSLVALQRYDAALAPLQEAAARAAGGVQDSEVQLTLGDAFAGLYRCVDALDAYRRAAALDEGRAEIHTKIGAAFIELGRCAAALQPLLRAIALAPDDATACDLLGLALGKMGRHAEALGWFERALALQPHCAATFRNMGNTLTMLRRDDQALVCFQAARRLEPEWDLAWLDEAGILLRRGDLLAGWKVYEWRESARMMAKLCATCWSGDEDLQGQTILLIAEQGMGDTLQFVRYVPLVLARGAHVVLQVQAPLKTLLAAQSETWGTSSRVTVVGLGEACPETDWKCLMMSLPRVFRTRLDTIPDAVPYLRPPAARAAHWRSVWPASGCPRVGVAWAGNPHFAGDATRSMPLATFEPLFRLPGIEWILLQPETRATDAPLLARHAQVRQFGAQLADFTDTAALADQVDLVIAVDTSVAHLAGALGRPLWLLLPFMPDWRWLHDRADSPWYPSARLFRQPAPLAWPEVVARVGAALQDWCAQHSTGARP